MSDTLTKTVCFMPRRHDLSRAAFRAHYETGHAPLAVSLFPFSRYRRNHLVDQQAEPGFDCISEFWIRSLDEIGALMAGDVGATMRVDEERFVHRPTMIGVLADPVATGSGEATTMLPIHHEGGDRAALTETARTAGAGLDILSAMDDRPLPCDAVLRCDGAPPALPPGWRAGPALKVEICETDPALLKG